MGGHFIDILRDVIGQNIHVKFFNFQCEMKIKMIENDKNHALIFFKMTIYGIQKVSIHVSL